MRKIWQVLLVFPIIVAIFLTGCSDEKIQSTRQVPHHLNALTLTDLWDAVVSATDIQDATAELSRFNLRADAGGNIQSIYFTFSGINRGGKPCLYFANLGSNDRIDIIQYETDSLSHVRDRHPMEIFEEIDRISLDSVKRGSEGLTIRIHSTWGDIGFSSKYGDIYEVDNGYLRPLRELHYHTNSPVCQIVFFEMTEAAVSGQQTSVVYVTGPVPVTSRNSQTWFLSEDVNRANSMEYLAE
ncbi:MAG: hypothetical protein JXA46_04260 [Dehalococcoidales bacterium]|nr:hypothetical protein [Dehalococcoidales bacterium]